MVKSKKSTKSLHPNVQYIFNSPSTLSRLLNRFDNTSCKPSNQQLFNLQCRPLATTPSPPCSLNASLLTPCSTTHRRKMNQHIYLRDCPFKFRWQLSVNNLQSDLDPDPSYSFGSWSGKFKSDSYGSGSRTLFTQVCSPTSAAKEVVDFALQHLAGNNSNCLRKGLGGSQWKTI